MEVVILGRSSESIRPGCVRPSRSIASACAHIVEEMHGDGGLARDEAGGRRAALVAAVALPEPDDAAPPVRLFAVARRMGASTVCIASMFRMGEG
jgi:hypothetical protein